MYRLNCDASFRPQGKFRDAKGKHTNPISAQERCAMDSDCPKRTPAFPSTGTRASPASMLPNNSIKWNCFRRSRDHNRKHLDPVQPVKRDGRTICQSSAYIVFRNIPDSASTAVRRSLWVSNRRDHAIARAINRIPVQYEPGATTLARGKKRRVCRKSPGEDDSRRDRASPRHRPRVGLYNAGTRHHSFHPSRPTVDRHPPRLRKLGAYLRDADWTSTKNRA